MERSYGVGKLFRIYRPELHLRSKHAILRVIPFSCMHCADLKAVELGIVLFLFWT